MWCRITWENLSMYFIWLTRRLSHVKDDLLVLLEYISLPPFSMVKLFLIFLRFVFCTVCFCFRFFFNFAIALKVCFRLLSLNVSLVYFLYFLKQNKMGQTEWSHIFSSIIFLNLILVLCWNITYLFSHLSKALP